MSDYKYELQMEAEEAAEEKYGKSFYDLSPDMQDKIYSQGMTNWREKKLSIADFIKDE